MEPITQPVPIIKMMKSIDNLLDDAVKTNINYETDIAALWYQMISITPFNEESDIRHSERFMVAAWAIIANHNSTVNHFSSRVKDNLLVKKSGFFTKIFSFKKNNWFVIQDPEIGQL